MIERAVTIPNPLGLHARPAAQLVKLTNSFACEVEFVKDGVPVNGKSIMGVMMLAAEFGSSITVRTDGSDEEAASLAIVELIAGGFGES